MERSAFAPFTGPAMGIAAGCITWSLRYSKKKTLYHKAQKERRDALEYRQILTIRDFDQDGPKVADLSEELSLLLESWSKCSRVVLMVQQIMMHFALLPKSDRLQHDL
jgi:hypothetical protein